MEIHDQTQLGKAQAHPLRLAILQTMQRERSISPNQLSIALEQPLGNVSYHVKTLLEYGCIRLVKTEPRRGAVEHFYRLAENGHKVLAARTPLNLDEWQRGEVAAIVKAAMSNGRAEAYTADEKRRMKEAVVALEVPGR